MDKFTALLCCDNPTEAGWGAVRDLQVSSAVLPLDGSAYLQMGRTPGSRSAQAPALNFTLAPQTAATLKAQSKNLLGPFLILLRQV